MHLLYSSAVRQNKKGKDRENSNEEFEFIKQRAREVGNIKYWYRIPPIIKQISKLIITIERLSHLVVILNRLYCHCSPLN